ncbi:MAG: preprotein translocase subunit YajC [Clostridia bacterium]|nr:preprotein translocase subunit YajC [Clostridia bacterium]
MNIVLSGTAQTGSNIMSLVMIGVLVLMIVLYYVFLVRPQKKKEQKIAEMRNNITVGDEIVTIGGIIGTVVIARDDKVMIETGNDKSKLTILRSSIKGIYGDEETEKQ